RHTRWPRDWSSDVCSSDLVSVQEMVGDGVEVIVGVSCDPQLGPVLLFGSGGEMVEVYNDVALRRCPITRAEAHSMIAEVKGARRSEERRGGKGWWRSVAEG